MRFRLPSVNLNSRLKAIVHACQGGVIFIAWVIVIAALTREGDSDGRLYYVLALSMASVPILIYLAAFPLWPRTKKFCNVHAFAALDLLSALLWCIAWIVMATYVGTGKGKNGCDDFSYGSPGKCKLATGDIILSVIAFLAFLFTSYVSLRELVSYRRTGTMPNDTAYDPALAEYSNEAFSTNPFNDGAIEPEDGPSPVHPYRTSMDGGPGVAAAAASGPYEAVNQTEMDEYRHATAHHESPYNDYNDYNARSLSSRTGTTPQPAPYSADPFMNTGPGGSAIPPVDTSYNGAFSQQMEEEFPPRGRYQY